MISGVECDLFVSEDLVQLPLFYTTSTTIFKGIVIQLQLFKYYIRRKCKARTINMNSTTLPMEEVDFIIKILEAAILAVTFLLLLVKLRKELCGHRQERTEEEDEDVFVDALDDIV